MNLSSTKSLRFFAIIKIFWLQAQISCLEISTLKAEKWKMVPCKVEFPRWGVALVEKSILPFSLFSCFVFFSPSVHSETMTWWMSLGCNPFIPCGGGKREFDSSFGLSEPESLWAEPPLPSNCEIFFLIIFLSFARRFWNQIFTWGVINDTWLIQSAAQPFYSNYSNGNAGKFKNTIKKTPKLKANKQKAIRKKSPKVKTKQKTPSTNQNTEFVQWRFFCIILY